LSICYATDPERRLVLKLEKQSKEKQDDYSHSDLTLEPLIKPLVEILIHELWETNMRTRMPLAIHIAA
jgi:hypothetical protein